MAITKRRERADTSLASNPSFDLQNPTAVLRVFKIIVEVVIFNLLTGVMAQASGVEGGSL